MKGKDKSKKKKSEMKVRKREKYDGRRREITVPEELKLEPEHVFSSVVSCLF